MVLKDSDGDTVTIYGTPHYSITTCNMPIGSHYFVQGYITLKMKIITRGFNQMKDFLDPGRRPHPEIPSRQMLWILTMVCLKFMLGDYWMPQIRPDFTKDFAYGIDKGILELFETTIGINTA